MIQCHGFGFVLWSSDFEKSSNSNMAILWQKKDEKPCSTILVAETHFAMALGNPVFKYYKSTFSTEHIIHRKSTIFPPNIYLYPIHH